MSTHKRLWTGLAALLLVSFSALLWVGSEIHRVMPPVPTAVVTERGETILTRADIEKGRQVWQSIGGQQLGSIWGHGSYVAPDWTADWLHREATAWLDIESLRQNAVLYSGLGGDAAPTASASEHLRRRHREHRRLSRSCRRDRSCSEALHGLVR
jgi:nitric oxide reductase subunit B